MKKRIKRISMPMAVLAGVVPTGAPLVLTLSSCSKKASKVLNYDHEYGITKKSYEDMKGSFGVLYKNEMIRQGYHDEVLEQKMNGFANTLARFDKTVNSTGRTNRYAAATFALSHFAKTKYDIDLKRDRYLTKKITWSNIDQMFQGVKNSWDIYLKNNHMSDHDRIAIMQYAQKEYDEMGNSLRKQYPNDTLTAMMQAQLNLVKCFDEVNEEIGLLAAQARLKDFMSTYLLEYNDEARENNGFDLIENELNNSLDKPLSSDLMNKVFKFHNVTTSEPILFTNDIIPNHIITPVLKSIKKNNYSNTFSLNIDWQIHKVLGDAEKEKRMTAHLYFAPNPDNFTQEGTLIDPNTTLNSMMEGALITPTLYDIQSTTQYAATSVINTYFNPHSIEGYISDIHWHHDERTKEKNPWEKLFVGQDETSQKNILSTEGLAQSGIDLVLTKPDGELITYRLKELLHQIDPQKPDEELDLAQKFVKYCDLVGQITIDADDSEHIASATFGAAYKNENITPLGSNYDINHESNFAISSELYADTNMDFNEAYNAFDIYKNNKVQELKDDAESQVIMLTIGFFTQLAFSVFTCTQLVKPKFLSACDHRDGAVFAIILTEQTISLIQCATFPLVSKPIDKFCDDMDKMKAELSKEKTDFNKISEKFDKDHDNYFVLWEKDKNPDGDFVMKEKRFTEELPWSRHAGETGDSVKKLVDYYSGFLKSKDWNLICEKAKTFHVQPNDLKALKIKYRKASIGYDVGSVIGGILVNCALDVVLKHFANKEIVAMDLRAHRKNQAAKTQELINEAEELVKPLRDKVAKWEQVNDWESYRKWQKTEEYEQTITINHLIYDLKEYLDKLLELLKI